MLLVVGLVLAVGGVAWAVATGVAIPEQDPSPDTVAYADFHDRVVDVLLIAGLAMALGGLGWAAVRLVGALRAAAATPPRGRP